ncbi:MAG: EF-hand domain-containing protein [Sphingobium sp.]|nr:EF-hand domain-containing protein [Sphingobium sp.]
MSLRLSHTLMAAGLLSLSAGAFAQPPGEPLPGRPGAPAPKDGPAPRGDLSRAELKADLETRFDRRDANHDGKLDEQDHKARHDQRVAEMFDRLDTDKNGAISKAEFAAAEQRREEGPGGPGPMMRPGRAMLFMHGGPGARIPGGLPFRPMRGASMPRGPMASGPDAAPGKPITRSDFVDRGLARFDAVDTNHDGKISAAERDAARGIMRDRPGRAKLAPPPPHTPQSGQ